MNKGLNLVTSKYISYLTNGIGWLLYGILSIFKNPIFTIASCIVLLICVIWSIISLVISTEPEDEMSKYNLMKAKAATTDRLKLILCIILLFITVAKISIKSIPFINDHITVGIALVIPLLLGVTEIMTGLLFVKYEKDGE